MRFLRSDRDDTPTLDVVDLRERLAPYVIDDELYAELLADAPGHEELAPVT